MKEWIELLAILIGIINVVVIPWAIWVTTQIFSLKENLAVNIQGDKDRNKKLDDILASLTTLHGDMESIKLTLAANGIKKH